jgi:hypothetical protein
MRIDKNLNFVFPVDTSSNGTVWVYSMPIARSVFETYYDVLGKVFTKCFDGEDAKHVALTAPQLALPALKSISQANNTWEGVSGVQKGLLNEIIRLTNVAFVGERGWETIPLDTAANQKIVDEENVSEIMSSLIFFTSICKVAPRSLAATFLEMAGSLREWQFTSSPFTEWLSSLPQLTTESDSTVTQSPIIS